MNTQFVLENRDHIMAALGMGVDDYAELAHIASFFVKYPYLNGRITNGAAKVLIHIEDPFVQERTIEDIMRMLIRREHPPEFLIPPRPEPLERKTSKDLWAARKGRRINHHRR